MCVIASVWTVARGDDGGGNHFQLRLEGFEENPAVSTTGRGELTLRIDDKAERIEYELRYSDLEGVLVPNGTVLFAHIHLGARATNGGVVAFLCGGGGKPACPSPSGEIEGVIEPADIVGPRGPGHQCRRANRVRGIRESNPRRVHLRKRPHDSLAGWRDSGSGRQSRPRYPPVTDERGTVVETVPFSSVLSPSQGFDLPSAMHIRSFVTRLALSGLALSSIGLAQSSDRINPMIALHERGLPVFGVTHPPIVAGRGSTSTPLPSLADAARDTVAYRFSDFAYDNYSSANADRFRGYMEAMLAAGGSAREHAFISKVPIIHTDPAVATARIVEQLNAGHVGVMLQEVESADEVRAGLAAMRFAAKGGTRPKEGVGLAAAYWKLTEAKYREKADPWPLNPKGELVLWAIVESKKGIANIREIAQVPGLTVIVVGAGTLGGVFSTTGPDGQRVRDQAAFDAGVSAILSACKEFKVACSHPANNPKEIEDLMARGFTVFTMQRRDPAAFDAIAAGRKMSGRR